MVLGFIVVGSRTPIIDHSIGSLVAIFALDGMSIYFSQSCQDSANVKRYSFLGNLLGLGLLHFLRVAQVNL